MQEDPAPATRPLLPRLGTSRFLVVSSDEGSACRRGLLHTAGAGDRSGGVHQGGLRECLHERNGAVTEEDGEVC